MAQERQGVGGFTVLRMVIARSKGTVCIMRAPPTHTHVRRTRTVHLYVPAASIDIDGIVVVFVVVLSTARARYLTVRPGEVNALSSDPAKTSLSSLPAAKAAAAAALAGAAPAMPLPTGTDSGASANACLSFASFEGSMASDHLRVCSFDSVPRGCVPLARQQSSPSTRFRQR